MASNRVDHHAERLHCLRTVELLEQSMAYIREEKDFKEEFEAMFPNIDEEIEFHKSRLSEKYPVMTIGETSSGKSSFLNLMMKEPLLPVDNLHSTAGIIKIQKGNQLSVVPKNGKPISPTDHDTLQNKGKAAKFVRKTLETIVASKTGGVDEKEVPENAIIDVYWPFENQILSEEVVIVDTPGYGENEAMKELMMRYLPNAVGFVYIVNAANAGGIQSDRLKQIIKDQNDYCDKHAVKLMDPKRALFFYNKWDLIESGNEYDDYDDDNENDDNLGKAGNSTDMSAQERVWSANNDKLKQVWPTFEPAQAMKISVKLARKDVSPDRSLGLQDKQAEIARSKIANVIQESLEHGLDPSKLWIKSVSSFISTTIEKHIQHTNSTQKEKDLMLSEFKEKKQRLLHLVVEERHNIKKQLEDKIRYLSSLMESHIKSEAVRKEMVENWSYNDFPCSIVTNSFETIKHETGQVVLDKLSGIIQRDMRQNVEKFSEDILCYIKRETAEVVILLKDIDLLLSKAPMRLQMGMSQLGMATISFTIFDTWSNGIVDFVSASLLLGLFFATAFFLLVFIALPFLFLAGLLFGWRLTSPHVIILEKTAVDVLEAVDARKLSTAITSRLKGLQSGIDEFFDVLVPRNINSLELQIQNICKSTEKAEQTVARFSKLSTDLEPFVNECNKISVVVA